MRNTKEISNLKIGFVGSMNAMPMGFALELKVLGFDVKYIVESERRMILMRPECHFKNIPYPYPKWIKEIVMSKLNKYIYPLFPRLFLKDIVEEMSDRDLIFFNDYGFQIARCFGKSIIKFGLFCGSDLDVYSDPKYPRYQFNIFNLKTYAHFFIGLPRVYNQRKGIRECHILSYFPVGFNKKGDELMSDIMCGLNYLDVRRYGCTNFREIGIGYTKPKVKRKYIILSPVRFLMNPESIEYKGNDLIIKAVGRLYRENKKIELHLFEKGVDADIMLAKKMCAEYGLVDIVKWYKEMPLKELLKLYQGSDIVIDQVGSHWPGAIAFYGLHMGKPVIANINKDICNSYWDEKCPLLVAGDVDSILANLRLCQKYEFREAWGKKSYDFAKKYINVDVCTKKYLSSIREVVANFSIYKRD